MTVLTSKLIVEMINRVTAPARAVSASIQALTSIQAENTARLDAMRGRMIEAGLAAYGLAHAFSAPIRAATELESKLEDIGQKIGKPVSELPKLGAELRTLARETTQTAAEIAGAMDALTGMGANESDALDILPTIGKAATAYSADITELAQAAYAAIDNLKVPASQTGAVLDAMAEAGKQGAFEVRDMAQYFPLLGASYQALGQTGVPAVADLAAALQIVRKATGDSAGAANNLANLLQKIRAPQTVKAFRKMGINLEKELAKASKKGLTPIEAIAEVTNKALKGDLGKLGDLFPDAQVQQALRPLIQNIEEYRRVRAEAMAAQGVVEEDYQRRLQTGAAAARRWQIALENMNVAVGSALLPALAALGDTIVPIIDRMSAFAEAHPALTRAVVATAGALVSLRIAAIAAQFSLLWMKGGALTAAIGGLRGISFAAKGAAVSMLPLGRALGLAAPSARSAARAAVAQAAATLSQSQAAFQVARAMQEQARMAGLAGAKTAANVKEAGAAVVAASAQMKAANAAFAATSGSVGLVTRAFQVLKIAAIGTGVGAIVLAIAAAGTWIYNNWSGISAMFSAFGSAFMAAIQPIMPAIQPVVDVLRTVWDAVSGLLGPIDASTNSWKEFGKAAGKAVADAFVWVSELPAKIRAKFDEIVDWAKGLPGRIASAIGSIDLGSFIHWPEPPAWLSRLWGGGDETAETAPPPDDAAAKQGAAKQTGGTSTYANIRRGIDDLSATADQSMKDVVEAVQAHGGEAAKTAQTVGRQITTALDVTAKPDVDTSSIEKAKRQVDALKASLATIPGVRAAGAAASVPIAGARAAGGPVRAGLTYLTGERGRELFTPAVDGYVHNAAKTARMLRERAAIPSVTTAAAVRSQVEALAAAPAAPSTIKARVASLPSVDRSAYGAVDTASMMRAAVLANAPAIARTPAPAGGHEAVGHSLSMDVGGVTIHVAGAPGQSPEQIAEAVRRELSSRLNALSRGAFSDGVYS